MVLERIARSYLCFISDLYFFIHSFTVFNVCIERMLWRESELDIIFNAWVFMEVCAWGGGGGGGGSKGRSSLHAYLALLWRHDTYYRNLTYFVLKSKT